LIIELKVEWTNINCIIIRRQYVNNVYVITHNTIKMQLKVNYIDPFYRSPVTFQLLTQYTQHGYGIMNYDVNNEFLNVIEEITLVSIIEWLCAGVGVDINIISIY
jgi:hypothetical protein